LIPAFTTLTLSVAHKGSVDRAKNSKVGGTEVNLVVLDLRRAARCESPFEASTAPGVLLQVIHKKKPTINHGWKTQSRRDQKIKPHHFPLASQLMREMNLDSCQQRDRKMIDMRCERVELIPQLS
jgi:hypothetical protein